MKNRVFRTMQEYLDHYKPKPKKIKGSKYYKLGVKAAREAIEIIEKERLKKEKDKLSWFAT